MKVLFLLTNPFSPDPRPLKEAKLMIEEGWRVDIACWDRDNNPVYPEEEIIECIYVRRIKITADYGSGIASLFRFISFYNELISRYKNEKYDCIYAHDLDTLLPAYILSRKKAKLILDLHELYEGMVFKKSHSVRSVLLLLLKVFKRILYRYIDLFVYTNKEIKIYDEKIIRKNIDNAIVIKNFPERKLFKHITSNTTKINNLCFFGNIRDYQILSSVMDKIESLNGKLHLYLAGYGPACKEIEKDAEKLKFTTYLGPFIYFDLPELYNFMDVVLCLYRGDKNTKNAMPVKFFEALEIGLAVIAFRDTKLGKLCEKEDIGFVIDSLNDLEALFMSMNKHTIQNKKNKMLEYKLRELKYFESQKDKYIDSINRMMLK